MSLNLVSELSAILAESEKTKALFNLLSERVVVCGKSSQEACDKLKEFGINVTDKGIELPEFGGSPAKPAAFGGSPAKPLEKSNQAV